MKTLLCLFLVGMIATEAFSQKEQKSKVRYKKYEYLDLGKLNVEGRFFAPTDIFIQERAKQKVVQPLYDRKNFQNETRQDALDIR